MFRNSALHYKLSILLSLASIALTVIINIKIAARYIQADGKTKALFGLTEILSFSYQYYIILPALCALTLAVISLKKLPGKRMPVIAILCSLLAIIIIFTRLWRLFI